MARRDSPARCRARPARCISRSDGGTDRGGHLATDHVDRPVPEHLLRGRVELDEAAVRVHGDDAIKRGAEDRALDRLASLHGLLRRSALGDVEYGDANADDGTVSVSYRIEARQHMRR